MAVRRPGAPGRERQHRRLAVVDVHPVRGGGLRPGLAQAGQPARVVPARPGRRGRAQRGRQLLRDRRLPGPPRHATAGLGGHARPARLGHRRRAGRAHHPDLPRRHAAVLAAAVAAVALPGHGPGLDGQCLRHHARRHRPARHPRGFRWQPAGPGQRRGVARLVERAAERALGGAGAEPAAVAGRAGGQLPAFVRRAAAAAEVAAGRLRRQRGLRDPGHRAEPYGRLLEACWTTSPSWSSSSRYR